jgi:hypothetical protein
MKLSQIKERKQELRKELDKLNELEKSSTLKTQDYYGNVINYGDLYYRFSDNTSEYGVNVYIHQYKFKGSEDFRYYVIFKYKKDALTFLTNDLQKRINTLIQMKVDWARNIEKLETIND